MRILVTGGAGLIGSHLADFYARKGTEVVVFDNLGRSKLFGSKRLSVEHTWNFLKSLKYVRCVRGDIRKPRDLERVFEQGIDAIIHTAAQPGVRFSIEDPISDFELNAVGTLNALESARRHAPRAPFIYCSTNKVYGGNVGRLSLKEESSRYVYSDTRGVDVSLSTDQTAHTPYGISKYTGDLYVQEYAQSFGMRTAVFRMSCIYGPRQFAFEDHGWLSHFVTSALKNRPITIYGDGKQVRDCLYVDDLVHAFDSFLSGDCPSDVFNIGGGEKFTLSLLELVALLEREIGSSLRISFQPWRMADQKVYISDLSHVCRALSWEPSVAPQEGVKRLIRWAREHLHELP